MTQTIPTTRMTTLTLRMRSLLPRSPLPSPRPRRLPRRRSLLRRSLMTTLTSPLRRSLRVGVGGSTRKKWQVALAQVQRLLA